MESKGGKNVLMVLIVAVIVECVIITILVLKLISQEED